MTQDDALAIMDSGTSVLLTGAAGTGKTYLLQKFIDHARAAGKSVAVTATTGLAATHLNGSTIHAWSGIGVHDELPSKFAKNLSKTRREQMTRADILIIDEISMLHDFRLDMVDQALRIARETNQPFGGLQVILCGDFFQLPPVNRREARSGSFVTESSVWRDGLFEVCYLQEQFRQNDDQDYAAILNGIRAGQLRRSQLESLQSRIGLAQDFAPGTQTKLLTTNADVDIINQRYLDKINQPAHRYDMSTTGGARYVEQLKRACLAPEVLELKVGASVMCIKNSPDKRYVNGSLGQVVDFDKDSDYPIVKLVNGQEMVIRPDSWELRDGDKKRASLTQLPLRLAWAITVHKSQGMTLDAAQIDLSKAFIEGMGYVALSRVRGLDYLALDGLNAMALRTSPLARNIDGILRQASHTARQSHQSTIDQWQASASDRLKAATNQKSSTSWAQKLEVMRQTYPNAYRPWRQADDRELIRQVKSGLGIPELSKRFGRHPGSIEKRLEKLTQ